MFIMGRQRRGFTSEYKDEAVKLVINTGRPVAVVARELGIQESTLGRWVNLFKGRQDAGDGALSETERAELARLRRENSELKMDRAFLKNSIVGGRLWSREKGARLVESALG
jgi:transposase